MSEPFDEAPEQARLQHVCTVAQLAFEWAKARRESLAFGRIKPAMWETEPHVGTDIEYIRSEFRRARMLERKRLAAKLSGLAARLERACLGPPARCGRRRWHADGVVTMVAEIEQADGSFRIENRIPECGEDFCDQCGDCLYCHGGDACSENDWGNHRWIVYLPEPE